MVTACLLLYVSRETSTSVNKMCTKLFIYIGCKKGLLAGDCLHGRRPSLVGSPNEGLGRSHIVELWLILASQKDLKFAMSTCPLLSSIRLIGHSKFHMDMSLNGLYISALQSTNDLSKVLPAFASWSLNSKPNFKCIELSYNKGGSGLLWLNFLGDAVLL